jgi:hypothetical protein
VYLFKESVKAEREDIDQISFGEDAQNQHHESQSFTQVILELTVSTLEDASKTRRTWQKAAKPLRSQNLSQTRPIAVVRQERPPNGPVLAEVLDDQGSIIIDPNSFGIIPGSDSGASGDPLKGVGSQPSPSPSLPPEDPRCKTSTQRFGSSIETTYSSLVSEESLTTRSDSNTSKSKVPGLYVPTALFGRPDPQQKPGRPKSRKFRTYPENVYHDYDHGRIEEFIREQKVEVESESEK